MNSFFNITIENNSFCITTPGHWYSRVGAETTHKLQNLLELRSQNDIELHVKEVRERGNQIIIGGRDYEIFDLRTKNDEILHELKYVKYNDLEDMVFRMEVTKAETEYTNFDVKYIDTKSIGYTLPHGICEITDINLLLKSLLPVEVRVNISVDDTRLKSNITKNKTIGFTKKSLFVQ